MASLVERVARRRAGRTDARRAADPVTLEEFGYLLSQSNGQAVRTKAGVTMSPKRALGITAWYSGCRYLAETLASIPVHTYRDRGSRRERRADPPWVQAPDVEQTWFGLVESWMMCELHRGNAYTFKLRSPVGQVVGLREIHPDRVTTGQAPDGSKRFLVDDIEQPFTRRDILHIPGLAYDGRVGLNPIQTLANALGGVAATDDYAQRFFAHGTHVGGIISVPQELSPQAAAKLKSEWDRFHEGLVNAHKTGVLSKGATYQRLALNAADSQLLESRNFGVTEVARMLRIPPHKLYDLTRATFSNIEHQSIESVVDSIRPWAARFEAWINADPDLCPPGNFIEFQLEGLLRGDAAARAAFYTSMIQNGSMQPKRAAELENLDAPDDLAYWLRPLNMAVIRPGVGEEVPATEATKGAA